LTAADPEKLDADVVEDLYRRHHDELLRFLVGVLRDPPLASDVLQTAFARLAERGHDAQADRRKAWLFRVAYHEALRIRRRDSATVRALRQWAMRQDARQPTAEMVAEEREAALRVREALERLPAQQRQVVRMRIFDGKKFVEIARELDVPLGTALDRMRSALLKLRRALERD